MSNKSAKRSRASSEQLNHMVDFMVNNPGLASGKFQKLHGKLEGDKKWSEMSSTLNSLGGAVKTVEQWHAVWKDLKSRTSVKMRERKKEQALTGNKAITQESLTDLGKRVVSIIGKNYIEGHKSVQENLPLNEEHQLLLEDGEEYAFELPTSPTETEKSPELRCIAATPSRTPRRCAKRKRVEEEDSTKKQFLEIANKQADALKKLGECTAANVEVGKMMAEAVKCMAKSVSTIANAANALANAINKL